MPPHHFESEVESFLEGSHGDRTHIKRADHPRLHHYAGRYSERGRCRADTPLIQAAAPVGGGKGWPGFEIDHSEPQARVWRSRGRAAAHGHLDNR